VGVAVRAPGAEPDGRLDRRLVEIPHDNPRAGGEEMAHDRHAHGPEPYHRHRAPHRTPSSSCSAAGVGTRRLATGRGSARRPPRGGSKCNTICAIAGGVSLGGERAALPAGGHGAGRRVFRSLAIPNYRAYFIGQSVSIAGTWMQRVAQDWLVLDLSNSAVALAIAMSLQFLPTLLFGLWGGVIADRFSRRRLIIVTQAVSAVLAVVLAVVVLAGVVELWMVYVLALCLGLVTVLDTPARQAFVTEMVGPADYVNAQALNSTIHNAG